MSKEVRHEQPVPSRVPASIERWSRKVFVAIVLISLTSIGTLALLDLRWLVLLLLWGPFTLVGLVDMLQKRHTVRRNYPVIGHLRYFLESLRPEIRQYFVESDQEENPISREKRAIVYSRAKNELDTTPFGSQRGVYRVGYEWINHSMAAVLPRAEPHRIPIRGDGVTKPYDCSLLNISAMSFGSLSANAIRAMNAGAKKGGFYHNTGEGGISPYHLEPGGDLVWQIGTGYFGCRTLDGKFDPELFAEQSQRQSVKMIEVKLSQGAKPGHGGILPAKKVSKEIAAIRNVSLGRDVISPPAHSAFRTPLEMVEFLAELRELSGGKPVGIKLCVGQPSEFFAICKAMCETGLGPDFITVDGAEGGTGAAPLEFINSVGMPLSDGLAFVHSALVGSNLRDQVKIIAAGKITTGFHMLTKLALGADICNSARAMMYAVGCIQALKCNTNLCPVGVATQDRTLQRGLDVLDKTHRVYNFQRKTVHSLYELLGAAGLDHPDDLRPRHVCRRISATEIQTFEEIYSIPEPGSLVDGTAPDHLMGSWQRARPDRF